MTEDEKIDFVLFNVARITTGMVRDKMLSDSQNRFTQMDSGIVFVMENMEILVQDAKWNRNGLYHLTQMGRDMKKAGGIAQYTQSVEDAKEKERKKEDLDFALKTAQLEIAPIEKEIKTVQASNKWLSVYIPVGMFIIGVIGLIFGGITLSNKSHHPDLPEKATTPADTLVHQPSKQGN